MKDTIVIHHSLTKDGKVVDFNAIRKYHKEVKGWSDIGYHIGLERVNGKLTTMYGRPLHAEAAACKEAAMNKRGIHICVVGNFDLAPPDEETYLKLSWICKNLIKKNPGLKIEPHRKYAINKDTGKSYKSCPGKNFNMNHLRKLVGL